METNYKKLYMEILTENTSVPNALLEHSRDLGLSAEETLFLVNLFRLNNKKTLLTFRNIAKDGVYSDEETVAFVGQLVDRGFLTFGGDGIVGMDGLLDKFIEAKSWNALKTEHKIRKERKTVKEDKTFSELYRCFEDEMGRLLSPIEGEQIRYWYKNQKIPAELIKKGLTRAVLLGKYNFRYVDAILTSWTKQGIHSVEELERKEAQQEQMKQQRKTTSQNHRIFRGEQKNDPDEPDIVL